MGKNYNKKEFSITPMFWYFCCPGGNELMSTLGSPKLTKDSWYSQEPIWRRRKAWLFVAEDSANSSSKSTKPRPNFLATFPTQDIFEISKEKSYQQHHPSIILLISLVSKYHQQISFRVWVKEKIISPDILGLWYLLQLYNSLIITSLSWLLANSWLLE